MVSSDRGSLARDPRRYEVTPVELFFDLVYVFAFIQLSRRLLEHLDWTGLATTVVLYFAVFWTWGYTVWAVSLTDTRKAPVRWMLLVSMLFGLFMNASIAAAFEEAGWWFVGAYLPALIGRTIWLLTVNLQPALHAHFQRVLVWQLASAPLWIAGAAAGPETRLLLWACGVGIDLAGTLTAHPLPGRWLHSAGIAFAAPHMFERCRLFFLIALGETVLTTGWAIADAPVQPITLLTGTVALAGTVAIWWAYFRRSEAAARRQAEQDADPTRASRYATNGLMLMVAGLISIAVGDELVIAHPTEQTTVATNAALYAGPALFLTAQLWFARSVARELPPSRLVGLIALAIVGTATLRAPSFVAGIGSTAVLVGVAIADGRRARAEEADHAGT
ncbi:low temperature requirement protein A [Micromonospora sp. WMMD1082]|uniref:low temperature requirement protein A n=1 Tax=Micromonospora sp. WMMD1082 TaxID=3016104 RepID=UPI002416F578|nr:low temperature requirement protein A [Micromonospora sp. WMMD1082]MDG4798104.1 low temperature requirement protein A [Micromonospora sp. WMMD1082]